MGILGELLSEVTGHKSHSKDGAEPQNYPPSISRPWIVEWDPRSSRWLFINQQNGERTFDHPGAGVQQYGGYSQGGYLQSYGQAGYNQDLSEGGYRGGYGNQQQPQYYNGPPDEPYQGQQEKNKHGGGGMAYGALGAAGGLAAGALLMHEGHKIERDWDSEKDRLESDAANFPSSAANWTGQQVGNAENFGDRVEQRWDSGVQDIEDIPQNIENIPQNVENSWDNAVDDVEDAPEDAANWLGGKVGEAEGFDDRMNNAYDDGRDDARYDVDDDQEGNAASEW